MNSLSTGGRRMRDIAELMNMLPGENLFGRIGTTCHVFDAGGPIDAPDIMPAGSWTSTEARTFSGDPIPCPTESRR